ncbi:hypothetical protein HDV02_004192 [Globomyces sp. JEL0801]|nr:hypothetical protein HDV02_004192 [Globomyces sp. JEL0801]
MLKKRNADGYYEYPIGAELRRERNEKQLSQNKKLTKTMNKALQYLMKLELSFRKKDISESINKLRDKGYCMIPLKTTPALDLEIKAVQESVKNGSLFEGFTEGDYINIENKLEWVSKLFQIDSYEYEYQDMYFKKNWSLKG